MVGIVSPSKFDDPDRLKSNQVGERTPDGSVYRGISEFKARRQPKKIYKFEEDSDPIEKEAEDSSNVGIRKVPVIVDRVGDEDIAVQSGNEVPILAPPMQTNEIDDDPFVSHSSSELEAIRLSDQISLKSLGMLLMKKYGHAWTEWEPETTWIVIHDDFDLDLTDILKNKIGLLKILLSGESAWESWDIFQKAVVAMNGRVPNFHMVEHVSPEEIAYAIGEMRAIKQVELSDEVDRYIAAVLYYSQLVYAPEEFFPKDVQVIMDERLGINQELKSKVLSAWAEKKNLPAWSPAEVNAVDQQVLSLLSIRDYIAQRKKSGV